MKGQSRFDPERTGPMYDNGTYRPRSFGARHGGTVERVRAWLDRRPAESWAFFAAGFVLAAILT
jgi:hypothetical protein